MDILSITSACVAVAKYALSTSIEIHGVITKCKNVPFVITALHTHLKLVHHYNTRLNKHLSQDATVFNEGEVETLRMSLVDCQAAMRKIRVHVHPTTSKPMTFFKKMKYVWNEQVLKEAEHRLKTQLDAQQQLIQISQL